VADPVHQWLGTTTRRTFWRTTPTGAVCLGYIKPENTGYAVYVPTEPGPVVPTPAVRLRWLDDAEAAARTMCAYWRVGYVGLEPSEDESDV